MRNTKIFGFLVLAAACFGLGRLSAPTTEADLKAIVAPYVALKLTYEGAQSDGGGYVKADGTTPKVIAKGSVEYQKLGCSPFVNAVLHRLKAGTYVGLDYKLQQDYGGDSMAKAYGLEPLVKDGPWTVEELHKRLTAPTQTAPTPPDGVYMFDVRLDKGWKDGRGTSIPKDTGADEIKAHYLGHVGFVVIEGKKARTYQMTSVDFDGHKDGLAFGLDFIKWLEAKSVYVTNKSTARIDLYRANFK